jgi:hypothetical protein
LLCKKAAGYLRRPEKSGHSKKAEKSCRRKSCRAFSKIARAEEKAAGHFPRLPGGIALAGRLFRMLF